MNASLNVCAQGGGPHPGNEVSWFENGPDDPAADQAKKDQAAAEQAKKDQATADLARKNQAAADKAQQAAVVPANMPPVQPAKPSKWVYFEVLSRSNIHYYSSPVKVLC